jgi:hypothetical protein
MKRLVAISSIVLVIVWMTWRFLPFPAGFDPDGWLRLFGIALLSICFSLIGVLSLGPYRNGDLQWRQSAVLLGTPIIQMFSMLTPTPGDFVFELGPLLYIVVTFGQELRN